MHLSPKNSAADAFRHSETALEFPTALELVAQKCVNDDAKMTIRNLHPLTDSEQIRWRLHRIEEVRAYTALEGGLSIPEAACKDAIRRATERKEVLAADELRGVAYFERALVDLKRRFEPKAEAFPLLARTIGDIVEHKALIEAIEAAIDPDGGIRDEASPKLLSLRKNARAAREDLRKFSDRLARKWGASEAPTYVEGRFMLLLPRELCRKREGIVHSKSHSGGSVYFEPFPLMEKNNTLETILADAHTEEARILGELTAAVVGEGGALLRNIERLCELDALNAAGRFGDEFDCVSPAITPDGSLRLVRARHPLLEISRRSGEGRGEVVPLDIEIRGDARVLVITGPNAGGKTVTLKTVGLLALMFQSGLQVPGAQGSEFPVFECIFADIGDEQSIAMSLSTFTSHLRHLDEMCRYASSESLCLIDEIGDGTDPDEGSALAAATLETLISRGAAVVATTHYGKVKAFALKTPGVTNASMAFDDANDRPLYRLLQGIAGRSRGIETARRLGFDGKVIARAEGMVGKETFELERVLRELESSRIAIEGERAALSEQSKRLAQLIESYTQMTDHIARFKSEHLEKAKREAESILLDTRREIEAMVKQIREGQAQREHIREARDRIRRRLAEVRMNKAPKKTSAIAPGDRVSLNPSGEPSGRVTEVHDGSATVEINGKTIRILIANLYKLEDEPRAPESVGVGVDVEALGTTTVDVRGKDRSEAIETVDRFLDRAVLNGLREIKIVHGVGEGILVRAIHSFLQKDSRVKTVRRGLYGEGGAGVSFVELA